MICNPRDAELSAFKPDNLAELRQLRPERCAGNLDREIAGIREPAEFEMFANGGIGNERLIGPPIPSHGFTNFIQHPRQIGGFFVFELHAVWVVSICTKKNPRADSDARALHAT